MSIHVGEELKEDFSRTGSVQRVRYFHGMILDESDLGLDQRYHRERDHRLNRYLHGWGILCGLNIAESNPPSSILTLSPGAALDCNGHLIEVCTEQTFDLSSLCKPKEPCKPLKQEEKTFCVWIERYEKAVDPRTLYVDGESGCEKSCENARVVEGYRLRFAEGKCDEVEACCPPLRDGDKVPPRSSADEVLTKLLKLCEHEECPDGCHDENKSRVVLGWLTVDCDCIEVTLGANSGRSRRYAWTASRLTALRDVVCDLVHSLPFTEGDSDTGVSQDEKGKESKSR